MSTHTRRQVSWKCCFFLALLAVGLSAYIAQRRLRISELKWELIRIANEKELIPDYDVDDYGSGNVIFFPDKGIAFVVDGGNPPVNIDK